MTRVRCQECGEVSGVADGPPDSSYRCPLCGATAVPLAAATMPPAAATRPHKRAAGRSGWTGAVAGLLFVIVVAVGMSIWHVRREAERHRRAVAHWQRAVLAPLTELGQRAAAGLTYVEYMAQLGMAEGELMPLEAVRPEGEANGKILDAAHQALVEYNLAGEVFCYQTVMGGDSGDGGPVLRGDILQHFLKLHPERPMVTTRLALQMCWRSAAQTVDQAELLVTSPQ